MSVAIEVSIGELIDKITILEIKTERINAPDKLVNIEKELNLLKQSWQQSHYCTADIQNEIHQLKQINEMLWEIEDDIRLLEKKQEFGQPFIELARSVYLTNDKRAEVKRKINEITGSVLVEEKSYQPYSA